MYLTIFDEVETVMPQGMQFPFNTDVWLPLIPDANMEKRDNRGLQVCGRLVPGASQAEAQSDDKTGLARHVATKRVNHLGKVAA